MQTSLIILILIIALDHLVTITIATTSLIIIILIIELDQFVKHQYSEVQ